VCNLTKTGLGQPIRPDGHGQTCFLTQ